MSEPNKDTIDKTINSLTTGEIIKFLEEVTKVMNCPVCTHAKWTVIDPGPNNFALIGVPRNGGFSIPPAYIPLIGVACDNCGYLRSHAAGIVAKWKLNKDGAKA